MCLAFLLGKKRWNRIRYWFTFFPICPSKPHTNTPIKPLFPFHLCAFQRTEEEIVMGGLVQGRGYSNSSQSGPCRLWGPEKAMAPHSSTLAWKIPWMEEPGRLQSMGSLRVGPDWATSLSLFTFMHWRRKWQPTPVFLPGESQGRGSLVGCHLWGRTESDTTEVT